MPSAGDARDPAADPAVLAGVAALSTVAGALACLIPATRATQVDPAGAIITE
jgi:ABC-type lipoprotein release transport system permease subunit